jgi:hypothetical protein
MLLPTGFRKKPDKLGQRPDMVPMEIQFFGVKGVSQECNQLDCVEIDDSCTNLDIQSEFDCEIRALDTNVLLKEVKNFKIDQLKVKDFSISPMTIASLPQNLAENVQFEGVSMVKISESSLQLKKISGVRIILIPSSNSTGDVENISWSFSHSTIEGLQSTVKKGSSEDTETLFGNN